MANYLDSLAEKYAAIFVQSFSAIDASVWSEPWLRCGTAPQQNISGDVYNGGNKFSTMLRAGLRGFSTNVWGTFLQWKEMGVGVRKGETSVPVSFFDLYVRDRETRSRVDMSVSEYHALSADEQALYEVRTNVYNYNVFNADQTDMADLFPDAYEAVVRASAPADHSEDIARVDDLVSRLSSWVCPIAVVPGKAPSYHIPLGVVYTPPKEEYKTNRDYYVSFFRSLAHSTGAKGVLDRPSLTDTSMEGCAREELICEFAAALVCNRVGLDATLSRDNMQYMKLWTGRMGKEPKVIYSVIRDAVKASEKIISALGLGKEMGVDIRKEFPQARSLEQGQAPAKRERRRASKAARRVASSAKKHV